MSYIGATKIGKMYLGSTEIGKAYLGSNLVYQSGSPTPPSPTPTLLYELSSPTTTQDFDTGVKLFETAQSFTILCAASFNNYSWSGSTPGIFGISTGFTFRVGRIASGNVYSNGEFSSTQTLYTALIMNKTSTTKMCTAMYGRQNDVQSRRFAVRYDAATRKVEAFLNDSGTTSQWYIVPDDIIGVATLKLLIGNASGTVSELKVYSGLLETSDISTFIARN